VTRAGPNPSAAGPRARLNPSAAVSCLAERDAGGQLPRCSVKKSRAADEDTSNPLT
jgi:hypothetical protein